MLAEIEFIQFLPNGLRKRVTIQRGSVLAQKAAEIKEAGYRLECKAEGNGTVAVAIADHHADAIIASRCAANGPDVPLAVDAMINEFHAWLVSARADPAPTKH